MSKTPAAPAAAELAEATTAGYPRSREGPRVPEKQPLALRDPQVEKQLDKHQRATTVSLKEDKAPADTNRKPTTRSGLQKKVSFLRRGCVRPLT